jgi:DNA-binding beta-propeller fold protein YncE
MVVLLGAKCSLFNKAPTVPAVTGPAQGVAGVPVTFKATATDPDGDSITFQFDWGDTTTPAWSAFLASGETLSAAHTYADSGTYTVKAKAKDAGGKESGWAAGPAISVAGAGPAYPDSFFGMIDVGDRVSRGYALPDGSCIYAVLEYYDSIVPIRVADRVVLAPVAVGGRPYAMVATPDSRFLFVSCEDTTALTVVRTSDNVVVSHIEVGRMPRDIVLSPDGAYAYVGLSQDRKLAVVRTADNAVVDSIPLSTNAFRLAIDSAGSYLYATIRSERMIGIVDIAAKAMVDTLDVGEFPDRLVMLRGANQLCVTNRTDSGCALVSTDTRQVLRRVNLHAPISTGLAAMPNAAYVLVANAHGVSVVSVQAGVVVATLPYGLSCDMSLLPTGDSLYLYNTVHMDVLGRR